MMKMIKTVGIVSLSRGIIGENFISWHLILTVALSCCKTLLFFPGRFSAAALIPYMIFSMGSDTLICLCSVRNIGYSLIWRIGKVVSCSWNPVRKKVSEKNRKAWEHLKGTGLFDVVSGVLMGKPMIDVIGNSQVPVVCNINIGHAQPRCIIPFGFEAFFDAGKNYSICWQKNKFQACKLNWVIDKSYGEW